MASKQRTPPTKSIKADRVVVKILTAVKASGRAHQQK